MAYSLVNLIHCKMLLSIPWTERPYSCHIQWLYLAANGCKTELYSARCTLIGEACTRVLSDKRSSGILWGFHDRMVSLPCVLIKRARTIHLTNHLWDKTWIYFKDRPPDQRPGFRRRIDPTPDCVLSCYLSLHWLAGWLAYRTS
jgi:hypothetical protein